MKKIIPAIILLLLIANSFWSCEKDDICSEETLTTPSVIVEFYDKDNRTVLKPVSNFRYSVGGAEADTLPNPPSSSALERIEVPLRTDTTATQWYFRLSTPITNGVNLNTDIVTFNYTANEIYVSRACGYRSTFTLNPDSDETPNPFVEDIPEQDGLWIRDISLEQPNVENENEVHVKIYY